MNALTPYSRTQTLSELSQDTLDILIVGGGIVGSGIARDAAMRGMRVGLIEQNDFASGTSSRSSRLLHGGLRYLAQGRLGLVREASVEKRIIHHIAPHLAAPLPFLFPTRSGDRHWPLWQLKIGVKLYDALCGWQNLGRSQWLGTSDVRTRLPQLDATQLNGAVRYFDGLTNDARLVMDTLRSASQYDAILCNRARFENSQFENGIWRAVIHDTLEDRHFDIRTRWIVNAAGPWAGVMPHSSIHLRLTKGVHLVVDRQRLPVSDAIVLTDNRRILFAIPWGQRVILGTTDTDHDGPLEDIRTQPQDITYLLEIINRMFPDVALDPSDILSSWAGLRPLVANRQGHPSDASRSHEIHLQPNNWLDVAGGKLTTYRLIAQQAVDKIARHLGHPTRPCRTAQEPLISPEAAVGISSIIPPEITRQAVEHYCRYEWAQTLEDVMLRRSSWHYYYPQPLEIARTIAPWMAVALHWDPSRVQNEIARYAKTFSV